MAHMVPGQPKSLLFSHCPMLQEKGSDEPRGSGLRVL